MTMVNSIARLVPEVLGKEESHKDDSFSTGLLEYPQYTRPKDFRGMLVPDVLTSGHHKNIEIYRMKESLRRTYLRRPDLLENYELSEQEEIFPLLIKDWSGSSGWKIPMHRCLALLSILIRNRF